MRLRFNIIVILILSFAYTSAISAQSEIIAIVNNEIITQKDLDDFVNFMRMQMSVKYSEREIEQRIKQMLPDLIDKLIEDRLILQAAYKEGISIEQVRIKSRLEQIKKGYPTESEFQDALVAQGLSLADIELKIKEQLLMMEIIQKKVRSKIEVKPKEVTDYYNEHREEIKSPEQRQVRVLVVRDSSLIGPIRKSISEYNDLDTIAQKFSLEITDFDWVTSRQLKEDIAKAVFKSRVGQLTTFSDSEGSFYVLEVKAVKPPAVIPLFDVQEEIKRMLFERKMREALVKWLDELRAGAYIEIKVSQSDD